MPNINYFDIDIDDISIGKRMCPLKNEKAGKFSEDEKDYSSWDKKSNFGVLISKFLQTKEFEYFVCDDLNTEIIDFSAINEKTNINTL